MAEISFAHTFEVFFHSSGCVEDVELDFEWL